MPVRLQDAPNECGPACLWMIAQYHGQAVDFGELREACELAPRGTSMAQLADVAERLNFRVLNARMSLENLRRVNFPALAYLGGWHFVVIESISRRQVRIVDPLHGRSVWSLSDFASQWCVANGEGLVLILETSARFPATATKYSGLRFFASYLAVDLPLLAQALISVLLGSVLQLLGAFLTRALVDGAIASRSFHIVALILTAELTIFLVRTANDFLRSWIMTSVGARVNIAVIADFLKQILLLPLEAVERWPVGDVTQRIGDHSRVQSFLTSTAVGGAASIGNLFVFALGLWALSGRVLILFLVAAVVQAVWTRSFWKRRRDLDQRRFRQSSETQTTLIQIIAGMRDIRLANAERHKRSSWEQLQAKQFQLTVDGIALTQYLRGGSMAISELKNILITIVSAIEVIHGRMSLGTMLAISYMMGSLSSPLDQLIGIVQGTQDAKISVDRIAEVHTAQTPDRGNGSPAPFAPRIRLEGVSFRYASSESMVLRDIDLDIPSGSRVAIVGPSGSGKTTLVKLLSKFYAPVEGRITVNGQPLADVDTTGWRNRCGIVLQDGFIFSDSLETNIALCAETPDRERIVHVARLARLTDLVSRLPEAYATRIGPSGHELSAGERQRVLIARALYHDPDIFIFDEATSSLDGENEREILKNLRSELQGKMVITVAHRLSTVVEADRIVVLENGVLTEYGTHHDLVQSRGSYYNLIKNQLELGR